MAAAREAGVAGMKFKVGGRTPEEDARRFIEARKAAGDDFALIADANQGYTPDDAVRFARLVEDHDLFYFEEPCRWHNDRRAMRDVRYRSGARVCAGQSELSAGGCRDLMVESAIDFCNFDGPWSGGPTEWRRVAAMALSFGVRMCHHEEAHIGAHLEPHDRQSAGRGRRPHRSFRPARARLGTQRGLYPEIPRPLSSRPRMTTCLFDCHSHDESGHRPDNHRRPPRLRRPRLHPVQ
jgi:hypothetical protein